MLVLVAGCNNHQAGGSAPAAASAPATVLLSVTSDATANPQSVDMAMKLAGFSVDEGRQVVMFFNVKGVLFPSQKTAADLAFKENEPLQKQLSKLIARGVDVHVCPICMKALGVEKSDLLAGAKVTTRPALFKHIGSGTAVFTY